MNGKTFYALEWEDCQIVKFNICIIHFIYYCQNYNKIYLLVSFLERNQIVQKFKWKKETYKIC